MSHFVVMYCTIFFLTIVFFYFLDLYFSYNLNWLTYFDNNYSQSRWCFCEVRCKFRLGCTCIAPQVKLLLCSSCAVIDDTPLTIY
uniref:Uncharacterized protein n=1 Tax=Arundo donax TaxID=35708 RepID=A0A0A9FD97_ARUDO